MAHWSIKCWDDVGGPEDGIIPHTWYSVFEADTEDEAWNKAEALGEITCYWYDEWGAPHRDIRPSTEDEIAEYEYLKEIDEEYKREYGYYPGEEPTQEDPTQGDEIRTPWGGLVD